MAGTRWIGWDELLEEGRASWATVELTPRERVLRVQRRDPPRGLLGREYLDTPDAISHRASRRSRRS